jgi:hypothetical protein
MMDELPTIKLRSRTFWYITYGLYGIWIVAMTINWVLNPRSEPLWIRWGGFTFLAGFSLFWISSLLTGQPCVKLTPQVLEFRAFWITRRTKWIDITEFEDFRAPRGRVLGMNYVNGKKSKMRREGKNFDVIFGNETILKFDEFRNLLFSYWEHAKQTQAHELPKNTQETMSKN